MVQPSPVVSARPGRDLRETPLARGRHLVVAVVGVAVSLFGVPTGCSDTSASEELSAQDCTDDHFSCPLDTTCWITSDGARMKCLHWGAGDEGTGCLLYFGQPTCKNGLICIQDEGEPLGVCRANCDDTHGCRDGTLCTEKSTEVGTFTACVAPE